MARTREIAKNCWAAQPALLPYITTVNTARDLNVIRMALGERTISYLGVSYGTYLGAVYTQLFPRESDRMVFDSNPDPRRAWRVAVRSWSLSAERAFDLFAGWAAQRDDTYGLGTTVHQVRDTFRALLNELDRRPVTLDGETYDGNTVRVSARGVGQHEQKNLEIAELLRRLLAARGQAVPIPAPIPTAVPTAVPAAVPASGPGQSPPSDNRHAVSLAIRCGDARWPTQVERYRRDAIRDTQRYP